MSFEKGSLPEGATPFKKGTTGNPNGRPKGKSISTILNELLLKKVKGEDGIERTRAEMIAIRLLDKSLSSTSDNITLKAIEQVLDRSEGKAKQTVEMTSNVHLADRPITFK